MGRLLADGSRPVFAASAPNQSEPAVEFLDALPSKERARLVRLFEKLAAGHRLSKQDFRQIRGKIYEFKDYQRRMLCFARPEGWFVANGFFKKTNAVTPEREINKAERILHYHEAAESGQARTRDPGRARKGTGRNKR